MMFGLKNPVVDLMGVGDSARTPKSLKLSTTKPAPSAYHSTCSSGLNLMANMYKLIKRDGQDIPNHLHKDRALLVKSQHAS